MSISELPIRIDEEKIAGFCQARGIRRLVLFGSVLREDFDPERSDVDVFVEFLPGRTPGLAFFGYGDELGRLLGRKVDLCSRLNKHVEAQVRREALTIYEQA